MLAEAVARLRAAGPLVPRAVRGGGPARGGRRRGHALARAAEGRHRHFGTGQFNMITSFGRGEIAVVHVQCPRAPGPSSTPSGCRRGQRCALRSPGGLGGRDPRALRHVVGHRRGRRRRDVVVMAGGIGLAPLRGAIRDLVERQQAGRGSVFVLVGRPLAGPDPLPRGPGGLGSRRGSTSGSPSTSGPRAGRGSSAWSRRCCRTRPSRRPARRRCSAGPRS